MVRPRKNQCGFSSVPFSIPPLGEAEEQIKMTEKTANSISESLQQKQRNTAEYLYQGATVVAALLLVLSAAV
jgi:hypothetical protein